ncbi:hypothetical protein [Nostoc parmelioides]|uniref:Uncharacterized protein n=1 Tax=Nostoc parmelioides FACHB-3921 TaxID=2692909 RepID=A0ABR8BET1_9NOSO|nr:hypothetical protein [Nostoc parmelioides]MBD2252029.1 hypothetical protein [Nostoc parmelioides FACHB-3921]
MLIFPKLVAAMKWGVSGSLGVAIRSKLLPDYDSGCTGNNSRLGKLHES